LEEKKYIKRVRHDEDKRVWTIQLAKKGKDITELIANHIEEVFNVFSKKHEAAELEQVLVLLREYVQYYKDIEKKSR
jgi:DNA-binding MarR family transcriptional regulator